MKNRVFLIIFSDSQVSQQYLAKVFDNTIWIKYWCYNIPNSIFIVTDFNLDAKRISELLEGRLGKQITHYIVKVGKDNYGRLPNAHIADLEKYISENDK